MGRERWWRRRSWGGREAGEREIRSLNMHPFRPPPLPHFPHTHTHTGEEKGLCRRWWLSTYRKRGAVAYSTKDQQSSVRGYGKGKLRFVGETLMSGVTPSWASDPSKRRIFFCVLNIGPKDSREKEPVKSRPEEDAK